MESRQSKAAGRSLVGVQGSNGASSCQLSGTFIPHNCSSGYSVAAFLPTVKVQPSSIARCFKVAISLSVNCPKAGIAVINGIIDKNMVKKTKWRNFKWQNGGKKQLCKKFINMRLTPNLFGKYRGPNELNIANIIILSIKLIHTRTGRIIII